MVVKLSLWHGKKLDFKFSKSWDRLLKVLYKKFLNRRRLCRLLKELHLLQKMGVKIS